jgi:hypothetical protein
VSFLFSVLLFYSAPLSTLIKNTVITTSNLTYFHHHHSLIGFDSYNLCKKKRDAHDTAYAARSSSHRVVLEVEVDMKGVKTVTG